MSLESTVGQRPDAPSGVKRIRVFVAIHLPDDVRSRLGEVQRELREILPPKSIAWTKPENIHLTLRFLGEVEPEKLAEAAGRLRESLAGFGTLDLVCERLGCFPDLRFPRVVWAWVRDSGERLEQLCRRVNEAVGELAAQPADKRFVGHATLGRLKQIKRREAGRLAQFVERQVERKFGAWKCDSVSLMRSELSSQGSRYTTLDEFAL